MAVSRSTKFLGGAAGAFAALGLATMLQSPVEAQSSNATTVYRANLQQLNNSGASGQATLRLSADQRTLTVMIKATGLEPGGIHLSHIHGLSANGQPVDSACPTLAQDSDGDGFVELLEGLPVYGPVLVDFMDADPDRDGKVDFTRTITVTSSQNLLPLDFRHIVIHGRSVGAVGIDAPNVNDEVNGTPGYKAALPVLCGAIAKVGRDSSMEFRRTPGQ